MCSVTGVLVSAGMLYMPEADQFYLDRVLGEKEPLHIDYNGMCSMEKFYEDPKAPDGNSSRLQLWMYLMRLLQYSDALEHLFSTGNGTIQKTKILIKHFFFKILYLVF